MYRAHINTLSLRCRASKSSQFTFLADIDTTVTSNLDYRRIIRNLKQLNEPELAKKFQQAQLDRAPTARLEFSAVPSAAREPFAAKIIGHESTRKCFITKSSGRTDALVLLFPTGSRTLLIKHSDGYREALAVTFWTRFIPTLAPTIGAPSPFGRD
jgi:hypothetical protein